MVGDTGGAADGMDEALCPVALQATGFLRDDDVFRYLVGPLPEGVQLTAVLDCCHSGTILDLPYIFIADSDNLEAVNNGSITHVQPNGNFDFGKVLQIIQDLPGMAAA